MAMKLPTLYKIKKKVLQWEIETRHSPEYSEYIITHGQKDGKLQTTSTMVTQGKNLGKANETSIQEQCDLEAKALWQKQIDRKGYNLGGEGKLEDGSSLFIYENYAVPSPMLALEYDKFAHKVVFPCYIQPKLDGCLSGDSLIHTKEYGYKSIKWLVENQIYCKVKSFNTDTQNIEYQKITGHFLNKDIDEDIMWYELELESGEKLRLTGNHEVYLPDLNCWRRVDQLDGNENLMVI